MTPAAPPLRAVLMDLDGTLYHQPPLRARMLLELASAGLRMGPLEARTLARRLGSFRRVREELRDLGRAGESLETLQYTESARRLGETPDAIEGAVREWIHERPLRHLLKTRRAGLVELLGALRERGLLLGIFSDYPASPKLEALGVAEYFDLRLGATDADINAFKPHPRGFEVACERWGLSPEEVLYVGDREEVDGAGARRAGMRALVFSKRRTPDSVRDCAELKEAILAARS